MLNYKTLHSKIEEQETNAIYYLLRKFGLLQETVILSKVSSVNGKYGIYKYDTENEKLIISNVELATFYKVTFTIFDSNNNIRKVTVTGKETNGRVNITIPYITSKKTLLEKIEVVITYAREIKPISYPYELNVSLDKDIIQVEESATFSCKLLEDNVGIGGETLSYKVIKDSVIDSGSVVTDANGEATISYTGTGVGQIKVVISYGIFLQETFVVYDCIQTDSEVTASKTYNVTLSDTDFYLEFVVHPTDTNSTAYINITDGSNHYLQIGDLYGSNRNCGVNWTNGTFYGKVIGLDTDTKVTLRRTGTNAVLTVGETTYNITNMDITCTTLLNAVISNNSIKNFIIYSISSDVHTYSLSVVSDKDIISYADGESATLTATLKDNGVVVSGETLSYTVKHGSTTIDTGTVTTGSDGKASISYTGSGVGDVDIVVSYGTLLQETFVIEDCMKYYPLVDNSDESAFTIPSGTTVSYSDDGMRLSANAYNQIKLTDKLTTDCSVEFTVSDYSTLSYSYPPVIVYAYTNGETTPNQLIMMNTSDNTYTLFDKTINEALPKNKPIRIEYTTSAIKVYVDGVLKGSASNTVGFPTRFEWHTGKNRWVVYKDLKVKPL